MTSEYPAFHQILSPELLKKLTNIEQGEEMYRRLLQEHRGNGYILSVDNKPHCIQLLPPIIQSAPLFHKLLDGPVQLVDGGAVPGLQSV